MASTQPTRGTPADGVHLVNLTEHEIALQAHPSSAAGEGAERRTFVPAASGVSRSVVVGKPPSDGSRADISCSHEIVSIDAWIAGESLNPVDWRSDG